MTISKNQTDLETLGPSEPDFKSPVLVNPDWYVAAGAPLHNLINVFSVPTDIGHFPMVFRYPGIDPANDLRHGDPSMPPNHDDYDNFKLGQHSYIDAIVLLTGGSGSDIDCHPITGDDVGSHLADVMNNSHASPGSEEDVEQFQSFVAEIAAANQANKFVLDLVIIRQMRVNPVYINGVKTNREWAVEERRTNRYHTYGIGHRPARRHRIERLLNEALIFARVQAHNLSFANTPRAEMTKIRGDY
jgi:hypothetical protein